MGLGLLAGMRQPLMRTASWVYRRFNFDGAPRPGLRILMYHAIGTEIENDAWKIYSMTFSRFEAHMRYLFECHRRHVVRLGLVALTGDPVRIALTFDDGYRDNLLVAAPLLAELKIPFTVFICTGAVVGRKPGFLSPEEVRELGGLKGATIGSHSITHPRLTEIDNSRLHEELTGSKAYLEDLLGKEIDSVAYPEGAVNQRVRDAAEQAGYRIGATSRFDINHPTRDPLLLCRTDIWSSDDVPIFEQKIRGDWDWYRWRHADPA